MMDNNGFFRFVWRFNGIVIMLLLLGALVCGGVGLAARHHLIHWKWLDARTVHMPKGFQVPQGYSLVPLDMGLVANAAGERLYALDRYVRPRPPFGPFVTAPETVSVNVLAINEKTRTSRWLFTKADRLILSQTTLYGPMAPAKNDEMPAMNISGVVFVIADTDTNKDGKITAQDAQSLYIYRMDGKEPVKVLDADRIVLVPSVYGAKHLELFYQKGDKSFAVTYSLPKLELESQIAISDLPMLNDAAAPHLKIGFVTEPRD